MSQVLLVRYLFYKSDDSGHLTEVFEMLACEQSASVCTCVINRRISLYNRYLFTNYICFRSVGVVLILNKVILVHKAH